MSFFQIAAKAAAYTNSANSATEVTNSVLSSSVSSNSSSSSTSSASPNIWQVIIQKKKIIFFCLIPSKISSICVVHVHHLVFKSEIEKNLN